MHAMLRYNEKNESKMFDESVEKLVWRNRWRVVRQIRGK